MIFSAEDILMHNAFTERLAEEWNKHSRLIIAVDFDDTIKPFRIHMNYYDRVMNLLRECANVGAIIICFTAREEERWPEIREFYEKNQIPLNAINKTPDDIPKYGRTGKVYANIFLDDRAGLSECLVMLQKALDLRKEFLQAS